MDFRTLFLPLTLALATEIPEVSPASWCQWVPASALQHVSSCGGQGPAVPATSAECADWCSWVPTPTWKDIADCRPCETSEDANQTEQTEAQVPNAVEPKIQSAHTGLKVKTGFSHPTWCRYVPWGSLQYVPACRGYDGVYDPSRANLPLCAAWCRWVPVPSFQYVADCQSCYAYGGGCEHWCVWVPRGSWPYTAGCSGCI
mmetsp:Transcript_15248/g.28727  ORF Transcript_15248/g.28727 Transcript_15248/m.28727 type:complete len:201 (+) Transcript_15248:66-668(+)